LVLGFDLTEDQQAIFGNQMNLLLSLEKEATEDIQLIDPSLSPVEKAVSGKLLRYVHRTQLRELSHLQKIQRYEIKD
ncbi:hypothetical protein ACXWOJ_09760, partial [Streptococcus pyogenes]